MGESLATFLREAAFSLNRGLGFAFTLRGDRFGVVMHRSERFLAQEHVCYQRNGGEGAHGEECPSNRPSLRGAEPVGQEERNASAQRSAGATDQGEVRQGDRSGFHKRLVSPPSGQSELGAITVPE